MTTPSHSELFGLEGQKRASTTAGAGAGSGVIGTSGHTGAANKAVDNQLGTSAASDRKIAGMSTGGSSNALPGSGADHLTPSQGTGDVIGDQGERKKSTVEKLNPFK